MAVKDILTGESLDTGKQTIWLALLGIICLGALLKVVATATYNLLFHPLRVVPGPPLAKIVPQYMVPALLGGRRAQTLLRLHEQYGSVVRIGPNEVSTSDHSVYRDIYSLKGSTKEKSFYSAASFLGHQNIFSMTDKEQHAGRRKLQSQPYSQQSINANEGIIHSMAHRLADRILLESQSAKVKRNTCDVFTFCGLFSLETICRMAFNTDICQDSQDRGLALLRAMDDSAKMFPITAALPFLKTYDIGQYVPGTIGHVFKQFKLWEVMTRDLFQQFQSECQQDKAEKFIATPLLLKEDTFLGRKLSQDEAVEEAMGLAFAGSGTTSTTLVYLLYHLSCEENRSHQLKLHKELQDVDISLQNVKDLPYLNAVIKETMRLSPTIISTLPRVLDTPLSLKQQGLVLPRGTVIGMQNYVHQRDPKVYQDPHTFNPERWIGIDASNDMEKALTPFSVGPFNCIGQNLAKAELYLAVATLFQKLDLRLDASMKASDMDMEDRFNISPRGKKLVLNVEQWS